MSFSRADGSRLDPTTELPSQNSPRAGNGAAVSDNPLGRILFDLRHHKPSDLLKMITAVIVSIIRKRCRCHDARVLSGVARVLLCRSLNNILVF